MTPQHEEGLRLLRLARRDQTAFLALLNAPGVDFAVACFHAQQAAEKALKAVMSVSHIEFRRTHDLEELAAKLAEVGLPPAVSEADLTRLTPYAVEFRYDDEAVHLLTADEAGQLVAHLLSWASSQIQKNERAD